MVEGGTSVNSIPSSARAKLDLRSEDPQLLDEIAALRLPPWNAAWSARIATYAPNAHRQDQRTRFKARGASCLKTLLCSKTLQAVDSFLNIRARVDCASTDANVPLSMGLPAVSIGAGGQGGGAHTNQEWYQPETRDLGLRRISWRWRPWRKKRAPRKRLCK